MTCIAWELSHAVETNVSLVFAWNYWTNVTNWDDPPARFELDGPFASGAQGSTLLPGQEPLYWRIRDVRPPNAASIEMPLAGAMLSFEWRLEELGNERTRLNQRVVLTGDNASAYLAQVRDNFDVNVSTGMKKLASAMEAAYLRTRRTEGDSLTNPG